MLLLTPLQRLHAARSTHSPNTNTSTSVSSTAPTSSSASPFASSLIRARPTCTTSSSLALQRTTLRAPLRALGGGAVIVVVAQRRHYARRYDDEEPYDWRPHRQDVFGETAGQEKQRRRHEELVNIWWPQPRRKTYVVPPVDPEEHVQPAIAGELESLGDDEGDGLARANVAKPSMPQPRERQVDAAGRAHAVGRRKTATAACTLSAGSGRVMVNKREMPDYFAVWQVRDRLMDPFVVTERLGQFDVTLSVRGGGLSAQAGACRHAIARALQNYDPALRPSLKLAGYLTRDARMVERKKPGQRGARAKFAWVKR